MTTETRLCACGCGGAVEGLRVSGTRRGQPRLFINHHNVRVMGPKSAAHRAKISDAQRRAWDTKRQRRPLGSTHRNVNGYLLTKVGPGANDWRPQHIVVVEQVIGRKLKPGEHVHHINAIRTDNRPENLHLFADGRAHALAHGSLESLLPDLLERGVIVFNRKTERYELA